MRIFDNSTAAFFLLTGLSLSIGWGIRGNFGHEYGAMIPGALAAMAAVLLSGREDWWRRIAYFAFFGALGWSFGGSMSYMQVIAYTHSGHSGSVFYGFACLFAIVGVTYLNLRKNPAEWVRLKAVPETLYGLSAETWFNLAYLAMAIAIIWTLTRHLKSPLPLVPVNWLGKGQLLYLIFLWWMVVGNFDRAQVSFTPQRLVTEGVIHFNAGLCTVMLLFCAPLSRIPKINATLKTEYATASNIKSRVNRLSVLSAISSIQERLKLCSKIPPNGLAIFSGTVDGT